MTKSRRGGYRKPSSPAAVSGPGALSQRTDGKQPIVRIPDVPQGQQEALSAQQEVSGLGDSGGANSPFPFQAGGSVQDGVMGSTNYLEQDATAGNIFQQNVPPAQFLQEDLDILMETVVANNPDNLIFKELLNARNAQKYKKE